MATRFGRLDPLKCQPADPAQREKEWLFVRDKLVPLISPETIKLAIDKIGSLDRDGNPVTAEKMRGDVLALVESHELTKFQRALLQGYVWEFCKNNARYWVDLFGYGYDYRDRKRLEEPFIMWESQRAVFKILLDHLHCCCPCGFKDVVIDKKTRREGGTYLAVFAALHYFLFFDYVNIGFVSLNFDDVDVKPDSIFSKMERILNRQPSWVMPPGWNKNRNRAPFCRSQGYIKKPAYDPDTATFQTATPLCTLFGESTTTTIGISQGLSALIYDELGRVGDEGRPSGIDYEIWERNADTTNCRMAVSTIGGWNTQHSVLVRSAQSQYPLCHVVTLAWWLNPRENQGMRTFDLFPPEMRWDYRAGHHLLRERYRVEEGWDGLGDSDKAIWTKKWENWEKNEEFEGKRFSGWYLDACCRRIINNTSYQAIKTELDGESKQSGSFVFPRQMLEKRISELKDEGYSGRLEEKTDEEGNVAVELTKGYGPITVFEEPDPVEEYVVTSDSGGGDGRDFSVGHVFIASQWPPREVAIFRDNRLGPTAQTENLHYLLRRYNDALFIPESNWRTVIETITHRFGYFKIFTRHDPTSIHDELGSKYGYFTGANKPTLINDFKEAYVGGKIVIRSKATLDEMMHFIDHSETIGKNDYGAEKGFHDDCVISAALLIPAIKYLTGGEFSVVSSDRKIKKEEKTRKKMVFDYPNVGLRGYRTYIVRMPADGEPASSYTGH